MSGQNIKQNTKQNLELSIIFIVHNEEHIIKESLEAVKGLSEDIIVIHDGPCEDKTLDIASQYTDKIHTWEFFGNMENHRIRAFKLAKYDWILQVDADEIITKDLREAIPKLINNNSVAIYEYKCPSIYKGKKYDFIYKRGLFNKNRVYFISVIHEYVKPTKPEYIIQKTPFSIIHKSKSMADWNSLMRRILPPPKGRGWPIIHAKEYLKPFAKIEKWNCSLFDWEFKTKIRLMFPFTVGAIGSFLYLFLQNLVLAVKNLDFYYFQQGLFSGIYWGKVFFMYGILRIEQFYKWILRKN
ncbi:glycosyltransferase [Candidatus Dojkabacteria bacterium]|nr:glycosyltransferase [Candidatus Dojkabacteria bacterium]